jgi:hypothetical protein
MSVFVKTASFIMAHEPSPIRDELGMQDAHILFDNFALEMSYELTCCLVG